MKRYLLGIDVGTSAVKCVVYDPDTGKNENSSRPLSITSPSEGCAELSCEKIWANIISCVSEILNKAHIAGSDIAAIGVDSLCPSLLAMDAGGVPLTNVITFMDTRSKYEADTIRSAFGGDDIFQITGNRMMAGASSATAMRWIKNHLPDVYDNTAWFAHIPTWLGYKLTGRAVMDLSQASGTGLLDIHSGQWSDTMVRAAGIAPDKLPPLYCGEEALGSLISDDLLQLGLTENTAVAVGGGDTVCTALALSAVTHGKAFLSLGTSHVLSICSSRDTFDPRYTNRSHIWKNTWLYTGAMSSAGAAIRWFNSNFVEESQSGKMADYTRFDRWAAESEPGANGLTFLPYLNGERSPVFDPDAKGVFVGIGVDTRKQDFARAVIEGCAYGIRQMIEIAWEYNTAIEAEELITVGGGSRSDILLQTMADITGLTLKTPKITDTAALGAALLGGIAGGLIPETGHTAYEFHQEVRPRKKYAERYDAGYQRYKKIYPACKGLFDR